MSILSNIPETKPGQPHSLTLTSGIYNKIAKLVISSGIVPSEKRYNISVSRQLNFVWFRVAKTGTRSFLKLLSDQDISLEAEHPMYTHYPVSQYENYFKFAIVRNPWDRLVSTWNNKIVDQNWWALDARTLKRYQNFDEFARFVLSHDVDNCDVHLRAQSSVIHLGNIDYIGRFENLTDEIAYIADHINLPSPNLPTVNSSKSRSDYRTYYTDELAEQVGLFYNRDISLFGYRFD